MSKNAIDKFLILCEEAKIALDNILDTKQHEIFLLAILNHVKSHPGLNDQFKSYFIQIIQDPSGPWEVVMYVMRELKWEEVRDATLKWYLKTTDIRTKAVLEDVLAVFEEEWDGSDLYEYYSKR
jgi:hypothetical protein